MTGRALPAPGPSSWTVTGLLVVGFAGALEVELGFVGLAAGAPPVGLLVWLPGVPAAGPLVRLPVVGLATPAPVVARVGELRLPEVAGRLGPVFAAPVPPAARSLRATAAARFLAAAREAAVVAPADAAVLPLPVTAPPPVEAPPIDELPLVCVPPAGPLVLGSACPPDTELADGARAPPLLKTPATNRATTSPTTRTATGPRTRGTVTRLTPSVANGAAIARRRPD